jgi:hypothetical protein
MTGNTHLEKCPRTHGSWDLVMVRFVAPAMWIAVAYLLVAISAWTGGFWPAVAVATLVILAWGLLWLAKAPGSDATSRNV